MIARDTALAELPIVNVENACASGSTALLMAANWIRSGMAETVLAVGVEHLSSAFDGLIGMADSYYTRQGMTLPSLYALHARNHIEGHGLTAEQIAQVSEKSRRMAPYNPIASAQEGVTREQVLAAPMIADPLTLFMCCPNADGAAAAVLTGAPADRRAVTLLGSGLGSGRHRDRLPLGESLVPGVAEVAYEQASLGPADVDVAEVHDAFAIGEILGYERLGFCAVGEGGSYVERAYPGAGPTAVNTSGGFIGRGHPPGATGLAQVFEIVRQLRREAGPVQVEGARTGLTLTMGGTVLELETNACVVHLFSGNLN
jgi:acetyl-CoA acetyltransferase